MFLTIVALSFGTFASSAGLGLTPITNANIHDAVKEWCQDSASAAAIYGDIAGWDTSEVIDMSYLFCAHEDICKFSENGTTHDHYVPGAETFNDDITGWNTANVVTTAQMFVNTSRFNQPIDSWDVGRVLSMWGMFNRATGFNQPLNSWEVEHVYFMTSMFSLASKFDQQLCWDISSNCNTRQMLYETASSCVDYSCCPGCSIPTRLGPSTSKPHKCT